MRRSAIAGAAIALALAATKAAFGLDFNVDSPRQVVSLDAGERVLINCPAEALLTIQPSKTGSAAVLQCADGGPGFSLLRP